MADIKGYTLAQLELWSSAVEGQRRRDERAMAIAARYSKAKQQHFSQYIQGLTNGR